MWPNKEAIPQFPRQIPAETETQHANIFQNRPLQCLFFPFFWREHSDLNWWAVTVSHPMFFSNFLPLIFSFNLDILFPSDFEKCLKVVGGRFCVFFCVRAKPLILAFGLKRNYTTINSGRFPSPPEPTVPSVCLQTCFPSGCDTCLFSRKEHAAGYSSRKSSC